MAHSKGEVNRAGRRLAAMVREQGPDWLEDEAARSDLDVITWWRDLHLEPMQDVLDLVEVVAPPLDVGASMAMPFVTSRLKRVPTIVDKLTREPGRLTDMADLGGVRAVVDDMQEADALVAVLQRESDVKRVRDWARSPRSTGYRGVHLHVMSGGRTVEIQVRTFGQDMWANAVEQETRLSGLDYKSGKGHAEVLRVYRLLADFIAMIELGESHPSVAAELARALTEAQPLVHSPQFRRMGSWTG